MVQRSGLLLLLVFPLKRIKMNNFRIDMLLHVYLNSFPHVISKQSRGIDLYFRNNQSTHGVFIVFEV